MQGNIVTAARWGALLVAAALLPGCGPKPQELVVGRWQAADGTADTVAFDHDGKVRFTVGGVTSIGSYHFDSDHVLGVTWDGQPPSSMTVYVTVTRDELKVPDPGGGGPRTYRRAK